MKISEDLKKTGKLDLEFVRDFYGHFKYQYDHRNSGQSQNKGPKTKATKWMSTTFGVSRDTSPVLAPRDRLYVQSFDGSMNPEPFSLFALNTDGSIVWSVATGQMPSSTPALGPDGSIYFGSYDGKLYALNPNGIRKWSYQTGDTIDSSPAVAPDGTIYIASEDNYLYALYPDGKLKWKYLVGLTVYMTSPGIGSDGTIYIPSYDDKLIALNPDGTRKWIYNFNIQRITNLALGEDDTIYMGSDGLYAINPDATLKWKHTTPQPPENVSAVGSDGTIYYTRFDDTFEKPYLSALTPDGAFKWDFTDGNAPFGYSVIGSDGTIYFGGMGGYLYALNPDGTLKWKYQKGGILHASPAIGSDGTLYCINSNCAGLYALADIKVTARRKPGQINNTVEVSLNMNQEGTIYWRHQSSWPMNRWNIYTNPIILNENQTVEFYGKNKYGDRSEVYRESY